MREVVPPPDIVESGGLTVVRQDCSYPFKAAFVYFEQLCIDRGHFLREGGYFHGIDVSV